MAFVRGRGHCAQLLATVYEEGRSRQVVVSAIPEAGWLTPGRREYIATRWPPLRIDWAAVDRALAAGPPGSPPPSPQARTWGETATALREWARTAEHPGDRTALELAARVLVQWMRATPPADPE